MYLLDTMVLSELRKARRNAGVVAWLGAQRDSDLFVSVISIGEIERGVAKCRASDPAFAAKLAAWLDAIVRLYGDRILPFDLRAARRWGELTAALGNESADLLIAATALEAGLKVVTRNVADFAPTGVAVLDPFSPSQR